MARRRALRIAGIALAVAVGYLLAWPVEIDPTGWEPPPVPEFVGVLAPNEALLATERLAEDQVEGPEDVALADDGRMFVGTHDGKIVVVSPDGTVEPFADTKGRPLGLAWDLEGNLIVADTFKGLLSVAPDGTITTLSTESDGVPYAFTDDVDVASDGRIYFTDASDRWGYGHHLEDILEGRGNGRLLRYDPKTKTTETLLDELYFANGVAVAPDDSFLLINETPRYRVRRYWLTGDRAGEHEVLADGLPGYPDGISRSPRGTYWVALFTPRNPTADRLAPSPFMTKLVWRLPKLMLPKPAKFGHVIELDADGNILRSLQDPNGEVVFTITSAEEVDGKLYLGNLHEHYFGRLEL